METKNIEIIQSNYGDIEIENIEPDIIQIWNYQKRGTEVIQIEREKIPEFIEALKSLIIKTH